MRTFPRRLVALLLALCCLAISASTAAAGPTATAADTEYGPLKRVGVSASNATTDGTTLRVTLRLTRRATVRLAIVEGDSIKSFAKRTLRPGRYALSAKLRRTLRSDTAQLRVSANIGRKRGRQRLPLKLTGAAANQPPTDVILSTPVVPENLPAGTAVGTLSTIDPNVSDSHAYSLVAGAGSADNAAFSIAGSTLRTAAPFDVESKALYTVRLRATDAKGESFEKAFQIGVLNVNEAPTDLTSTAQAVAENQPAGTTVGALSGSDPDLFDTRTFSLVAGEGDADNARFAINGGMLKTAAALDFEDQATRTVRVRITDAAGLSFERALPITVTNLNDAPTALALSGATVAENAPAQTAAGTLSAADQDAGDTRTFSLVSGTGSADNGSFAIDGATLKAVGSFDFETKPSYTVRVRVTDAAGATAEDAFTVTVTDVNDIPELTASAGPLGYTENDPATAVDGGLLVADQDDTNLSGATARISQGAEAADELLFADQNGITGVFSGDTLTLTGSATLAQYQTALRTVRYRHTGDNPQTTSKTVTFRANDGDALSAAVSKAVTVTAVSDKPAVMTATGPTSYTEGSAATAIAPGVTVTDPDSQVTGATVQITGGLAAGEDVLALPAQPVITSSYDAASGTLTLSGATTPAAYQSALQAVTYRNTSSNPSNATRTVTFTASDATGAGAPATRDVAVTATDNAPDVNTGGGTTNYPENAAATVIEDTVSITDPDSANLTGATVQITGNYVEGEDVLSMSAQPTITAVFSAATGTLTLSNTATVAAYEDALEAVRYRNTSDDPSTALRTVTYTARDATGFGAADTTDVAVQAVDDAPVAVSDSTTVAEDAAATAVAVLGNDTDVDAGTKSIQSVTQPANGTVVITGGGTGLTYAPNANYCNTPPGTSPDTFTYTLAPGGSTATVSITVACTDDAPVAVNDSATVAEDSSANAIDVRANDTDVDGGAKSIESVTQPASGTVVITNGGTGLTYTPNANYCGGPDTFTYTLNGGSTATVSLTVTCVDDAPVAVNDAATVAEDSSANAIDVRANDTDVDAGAQSIQSVTQPANGAVSITGGGTGLTYTPNANYCGGPDTFTYTLNGGSTATVSMTVTCSDDAPVAVNDGATVTEDSGANAIDVLANDTDVDAGAKAVASVTQPANGTVTITGGGTGVTYTPNANFCTSGTPDTFTYTLTPGSSSATVTVTVTCADDSAVANDDNATVSEDASAAAVPVLANDTDVENDPITITQVSDPTNGTTAITGGGTGLTYQPDPNYCNAPPGSTKDTFTYTIGGGDTATVSVTVNCIDDAPVAVNDAATVAEDSNANAVAVLANDTDIDGGTKSVTSVTQPANGTVVITGGGTGLTYTPNANYCGGPDTFTYTLAPGGSSATVSVTVTCADDAPVAVDNSVTFNEDDPAAAVLVLANDTDVDGGPKAIASATDPANGTVVLTGGSPGAHTGLTYQPDPNHCNTQTAGTAKDTFTYTLTPGGSTATVTVTVTCVDDPPVAVNDTATTGEDDAAKTIDVLANDTDVDGGPKTIILAGDPANGSVAITNAGADLTYTPDADYCNSQTGGVADTFSYTLNGGSSATVSVNVTCDDIAPTAVNDSTTVIEDSGANAINVLANDTDPDSGPKSVSEASDPANGTAAITGGGTGVTYQPDANFCGSDSFTYTLTPGGSTATVSVTVTCVDDLPVASDDSATVAEDSGATAIDVLANDTDTDAGPKTVAQVSDPANGSVIITGAGTGLTYNPDANYCSATPDTFTYMLNSTTAAPAQTATVSVTVTCVNDAPDATNDTLTGTDAAIRNTSLVVDAPGDGAQVLASPRKSVSGNILANDTDVDGGPRTITAVTPSATGSTVDWQADGDFIFTPAPGCTAPSDFFDYTVSDGSGGTDTARVTVDFTDCVWYVNNNDAAGNDGTSTKPFDTLGQAEVASGDNATVFVFDGTNTSAGYDGSGTGNPAGYQMNAGERLIGEHEGLTVGGTTLRAAVPNAHPTLTASNADVVSIDDGNEIRGVQLDAEGAGGGIAGGSGDASGTIDDVRILDAGTPGQQPGLELSATSGSFAVSDLVVSNQGTSPAAPATAFGILLSAAGNVTFAPTGTISVVTNGAKALDIRNTNLGTSTFDAVNAFSSASGGVTIINNNAGSVVKLAEGAGMTLGHTFSQTTTSTMLELTNPGTVTVDATGNDAISANGGPAIVASGLGSASALDFDSVSASGGTGGGVLLTNTPGAVWRFGSGFNVQPSGGTALLADNAGTIAVTGTGNALRTNGAPGLNVINGTNISADGLTFALIGITNSPSSGIVVNGNNSAGSLTISGINPGACQTDNAQTCPGGYILNSTGAGVSLSNLPGGASFTKFKVGDYDGGGGADSDGIVATNVGGFTLAESFVQNNGDATGEHGVELTDVTGTVALTNTTVGASADRNVQMINTNGKSVTATVTGGTYRDTALNATSGSDGIYVEGQSTGTATNQTVSITGATFANNRDDHVQVTSSGNAVDLNQTVTVSNNTMTNTIGNAGGNNTINPGGSTDHKLTFAGNNIQGARIEGLTIDTPGSVNDAQPVDIDATITGNTIGASGVANSGSSSGNTMGVRSNGMAKVRALIQDNNLYRYANFAGLFLQQTDGNGTLDATVRGNVMSSPSATALNGLHVVTGGATPTEAGVSCFDIGSTVNPAFKNFLSTSGLDSGSGADTDIRIRQRDNTRLELPGYAGQPDSAGVSAYLQPRNDGNGLPTVSASANTVTGGGIFPGTCDLPAS